MLPILAALILSQAKPVEVTATKLIAAYLKNEIGADAKYKNKSLRVTGTVFVVGKNASGGFYVTVHDIRMPNWVVQCQLKTNDPRAGDLEGGNQITFTGTGAGLLRSEFNQIFLTECEL